MPPRPPIAVLKRAWERIAPLQLAETSWDNVGVMIEAPFPDASKKNVLLTIDLTPAVCAEALELPSCSVVVAYHPPIFRGLKSVTLEDPLQASLLKLAARGISVFSPHTSVDATPNGVNTWGEIGVKSTVAGVDELPGVDKGDEESARLVEPFKDGTVSVVDETSNPPAGFEGAGMGKLVQLKNELSVSEIVQIVKKHLDIETVQVAIPAVEKPIRSIAVCAGSGGSLLKGVKADLIWTGEMSHHEVLACIASGQAVILCCHSNTERPYLSKVLQPWLERELNAESGEEGWKVHVSSKDRDPLRTV